MKRQKKIIIVFFYVKFDIYTSLYIFISKHVIYENLIYNKR